MGRLQFVPSTSDNQVVKGRLWRPGGRTLVAALAVGLTVALAQQPVQGTFTGSSTSTGNQVAASAQFCTNPDNTTLYAVADSWANEGTPASTQGGDDYYNQVQSQSGVDYRAFYRFQTLPPIPTGCALSSATLQLYTDGPDANRTLDVYLANPAATPWTETSLSWATQPAVTADTPASAVTVAANGYLSWTVTALVRKLYTTANNGFVVRDRFEDNPTGFGQQYIARQGGTPPKLIVAWD